MLKYPLTHPPLLRALAAAGHTSKVLIADANYPHATGIARSAELVHLNLRPGLVAVLDVLEVILGAVPVERAEVMDPDGGGEPPLLQSFQALLGPALPVDRLARRAFYEACRESDVAVAVATGEQTFYSNILLTIGALPPG